MLYDQLTKREHVDQDWNINLILKTWKEAFPELQARIFWFEKFCLLKKQKKIHLLDVLPCSLSINLKG